MSETTTPFLVRLPDGSIADHAPRSPYLTRYQRRPLTPRHRPAEPVFAAAPPSSPPPDGLVDITAAAAILGVPAAVVAGWVVRDPGRLPGLRLVDGQPFFDPTLLAGGAR